MNKIEEKHLQSFRLETKIDYIISLVTGGGKSENKNEHGWLVGNGLTEERTLW